jgi:hypothetical protein
VTGLRPPVIAGVAGGVGVTTLAVALRAEDAGRDVLAADVVVCRCTGDSLRLAGEAGDALDGPGPQPVLAVTAGPGGATRGPAPARLRLLEQHYAEVVVLPHVGRWRDLADPLVEIAALLTRPAAQLARPVRGYVGALCALAAAVARSGRLRCAPAPHSATAVVVARPVLRPAAPPVRRAAVPLPASVRPAPDEAAGPRLWPGLQAVERPEREPGPARPGEPDDVAIEEAGAVPRARPVTVRPHRLLVAGVGG